MNTNIKTKISQAALKLGLTNIEQTEPPAIPPTRFTPEASINLIKGDNLAALQWLEQRGGADIDFCYIDPPYNTGSSFVYHDKRQGRASGAWSKHNDWMAFMLPRLAITRELLKDTGVIAVSIDDYEYAYLKILMDTVFGEENHIATLVVCRSKNGKGGKANVAVNHEYVALFGKSKKAKLIGSEELDLERYNKEDEHGRYSIDGLFRKKSDASRREDRPNMFYPLYFSDDGRVFTEKVDSSLKETWPVDAKGVHRRWLWGKEKAAAESWKLFASPKGIVYVKNYYTPGKRIKLRSILDKLGYLNDTASREAKAIFGEGVFETPKPIQLIKDLIDSCSAPGATVLDFFAGTGTTAHACHILNKEHAATRRCILVEHNQAIAESHPAYERGFRVTSDITEFRLDHLSNLDPELIVAVSQID